MRPLPEIAARIGFLRAIEIERIGGGPGSGPTGTTWYRMRVPLVAGETPSPVQRLALFSDFTSASALYLDHASWSAINPDVTVQVLRPPTGEWLCLQGETEASGVGIGHSRSSIYDDDGFVASVADLVHAEPDDARAVLAEVGERFHDIAVVASREAERRAELEEIGALTVTVPALDHDVTDLASLLELGRFLTAGR